MSENTIPSGEIERPSIYDWAINEAKRFLKREKDAAEKDGQMDGYEYIAGCMESALKAYKSLCGDDHSGMSIGIARGLLNRLIDHKPLTPITGADDEWTVCSILKDRDYITYQNRRYGALFKDVFEDGRVRYSDNEQFICVDAKNPNIAFQFGLVNDIVKQYPEIPKIEFPYMPMRDFIRIEVEDTLSDESNGDIDTIAVYNATWTDEDGKPKKIHINRYFDISKREPREINADEWNRRCVIGEEIKEKRKREWEARRKEMTDKLVDKGLLVPKSSECDCGCEGAEL